MSQKNTKITVDGKLDEIPLTAEEIGGIIHDSFEATRERSRLEHVARIRLAAFEVICSGVLFAIALMIACPTIGVLSGNETNIAYFYGTALFLLDAVILMVAFITFLLPRIWLRRNARDED